MRGRRHAGEEARERPKPLFCCRAARRCGHRACAVARPGHNAVETEGRVTDRPRADRLWRHARLATLDEARPGLGLVEDGAVASRDGRIVWAGPDRDLPARLQAEHEEDCEGRLVTPGLIDCHTHLVFGGGPRRRIRDAARRRLLCRDLARGRRHRVERAGDAGRQRGGARGLGPAPARRDAARRHHHDRDQIRLRARPRVRADDAARGTAAGHLARRRGEDELPRRPCAPPGGGGRPGLLHLGRLRRDAAGTPRPRGWSTRSTASARRSPSRPRNARGCSRRRTRSGCR